MADPVLPDFFRAQAIFQGITGLPEDVFVNSFVFRNDNDLGDTPEQVAVRITDALHAFYTTPGVSGFAISQFMTSRTITNQLRVKVYDLGQAVPRTPIENVRTIDPLPLTTGLPHEVAVVLSFYADRNLPRRRGRVFIGPLAADASIENHTDGPRPHVSLRTAITEAAETLRVGNGQNISWHVLSGRDGNAFLVTGGWCDDGWDTQRRRGTASTRRGTWGLPPT